MAYRQGDYKLALREFRTAFRMNGFLDYLPFIADCERGVGEPKKAIEVAVSDDARYLRGEAKAEMFLVYAGALGDLKMWDKAIEIVHTLGRSKGLAGEYRMRAVQAEQYFLEEAGRTDEAIALDRLLDKLELQYADVEDDETSDDLVVEYDMQELNDELMDVLGISEDDAQYAPEDPEDEEGESEAIDEQTAKPAMKPSLRPRRRRLARNPMTSRRLRPTLSHPKPTKRMKSRKVKLTAPKMRPRNLPKPPKTTSEVRGPHAEVHESTAQRGIQAGAA